jgi:hypothetical protein
MASIITATTTSGLTQSADNSGVLQLASGTGNLVTVPSVTGTMITTASSGQVIPKAALPTGSVLQVISTTLQNTFSMSGTSQVAITDLTATITPTSATNKILVMVTIGGYAQGSGQGRFILTRAGSTISGAIGTTAGSRLSDTFTIAMGSSGVTQVTGGITYLDSPATTSSTTYGVTVSSNDANQAIYINYSSLDTNNNGAQRNISTITVMEIAA